jgi:hypothetical protein
MLRTLQECSVYMPCRYGSSGLELRDREVSASVRLRDFEAKVCRCRRVPRKKGDTVHIPSRAG